MSPARLGVLDTTFARVDMAAAALDRVRSYREDHDVDLDVVRRTVPGIKDLPAGAKRLISNEGCELVLALGQVGPEEVDKRCAHEATLGIQGAQLLTDTHVLEVFVHTDEVPEGREGRLRWLAERRAREHALNACRLLFEPERLTDDAGAGLREGFADAGPIEAAPDPPGEGGPVRIAIAAARFNREVTDAMVEAAERAIEERGHEHAATVRVPGAFDTPLVTQRLLSRADVDGVAVLGAVVTGDTDHDQVLMHATTRTLQQLSLEWDKPVALGITGPGMSGEEARERVDYGAEAVEAVVEVANALDRAASGPPDPGTA